MYIKYIACDGVSEVEEKIDNVDFGIYSNSPFIICTRSKDNLYYSEEFRDFEIYDLKKVYYIKD